MKHGPRERSRWHAGVILSLSLMGALLAGCTRLELENKADAYNAAIAESTNEAILLNAVRASQRAPMSFTALGQILATPNFNSNVAAGDFGFDPFGLKTYSIKPSVTAGGGFSQFTMTNMNTDLFMKKIRTPVTRAFIKYFEDLNWPQELVQLMFIASYQVRPGVMASIVNQVRQQCVRPKDERAEFFCRIIEEDLAARAAAECFDPEGSNTLLNTGRDFCSMTKFQVFLRSLRFLRIGAFDTRYVTVTPRSAQGMLYYLGELIAAQNYSVKQYKPTIYVTTPAGRRRVPLFVVYRGIAVPGQAAVHVSYNGDHFYIPKPELGSADEARSLQVLDLVSQVISAQTTSGDLPKISTIGVAIQ